MVTSAAEGRSPNARNTSAVPTATPTTIAFVGLAAIVVIVDVAAADGLAFAASE